MRKILIFAGIFFILFLGIMAIAKADTLSEIGCFFISCELTHTWDNTPELKNNINAIPLFPEWTITKTSAEELIDVRYKKVNDSATLFCFKAKPEYETAAKAINSKVDLGSAPVQKIMGSDYFDIEYATLDFKNTVEKCIIVNRNNKDEEIHFKVGWNSIDIGGAVLLDAAVMLNPSNQHIVSNRTQIYAGFIDSGDDRWWSYSLNNATSWTAAEAGASTYNGLDMVINTTSNKTFMFTSLYVDSNYKLYVADSSNNFATNTEAENLYANTPSSGFDCDEKTGTIHCVVGHSGSASYVNSSSWGTETAIVLDAIDDIDEVSMIEANGQPYAFFTGTSYDDLAIISPACGGWNHVNIIAAHNADLTLGNAIYASDGNLWIPYIYNNDLYVANVSLNCAASTARVVDTSASGHPQIAERNGYIYIIYDDTAGTGILLGNITLSTGAETFNRYEIQANGEYPSLEAQNNSDNTIRYVFEGGDFNIYYDFYNPSPPYVAPEDTCTYVDGDHTFLCSDNCVLSSDIFTAGAYIKITGTGSFSGYHHIRDADLIVIDGGCQVVS